jgi:hypothetical protein
MRNGIADATEVVLARTGHMFRFTHPGRYSQAIEEFLVGRLAGKAVGDMVPAEITAS